MYFAKPQIYDRTAPVISGATAETKAVLATIRNTNRQILIGVKGRLLFQALSGLYRCFTGLSIRTARREHVCNRQRLNSGAMIGISDHMPNFVTYAGMGATATQQAATLRAMDATTKAKMC